MVPNDTGGRVKSVEDSASGVRALSRTVRRDKKLEESESRFAGGLRDVRQQDNCSRVGNHGSARSPETFSPSRATWTKALASGCRSLFFVTVM